MTTPLDPYAASSSELPSAVASQVPAGVMGGWAGTFSTSLVNFSSLSGPGSQPTGVFGYSGTPSGASLFFSASPSGGIDPYGNTYPSGLYAIAGLLQGMSFVGASLDSSTTLNGSTLQLPNIQSPIMSGGTAVSLIQTMTNSAGQVLGYTKSNSTTTTFSTNGTYSWTCPTGVTSIQVFCWGAGAGGGGGGAGSMQGGEGGGGGEFAAELNYPVIPGQIYTILVGQGGQGGLTGQAGFTGSDTWFDLYNISGNGVYAQGGQAGSNFDGGNGGDNSTNSIHFAGGDGANGSGQNGGNGGGSSASENGEGTPGSQSVSNTGGAGGTAPVGGGNGGAGGNNNLGGVNGSSPGGAGGGAGQASGGTTFQNTYTPNGGTWSYWGTDATNGKAGTARDHDGNMWQGIDGPGNYAGHQFSYMTLPAAQIQSDLTGATVTSVALRIKCLGAYYSTGVYCNMRYSNQVAFGNQAPSSDTRVNVQNFLIRIGHTITQNVGTNGNIGTALQSGAASSILFGPTNAAGGLAQYGWFDSGANGGVTPELIVSFTTGAAVSAGNGADGQVSITYGAATSSFVLSVSAAAATDSLGNNFPIGMTSPQVTLTPQSTAATTNAPANSGIITASTVGTPTATLPAGYVGQLPAVQTDVTPFTVTQTGLTQLAKQFTIPALDPQVGTFYRYSASGNGRIGGTAQTLELAYLAFGDTLATFTIGATAYSANTNFGWTMTALFMIANTGSGGSVRTTASGGLAVFGSNLGIAMGGNPGSYDFFVLGQNNNSAINTTGPNTIMLEAAWGGAGSTISTFGTMLERLGT